MRLIASMIVRNERTRYLTPCIAHLLDFCDEIRVLDDGSDDGTYELLSQTKAPVAVRRNPGAKFYAHEGHARQALLDWTLAGEPTYVLAIDADEFVSDGARLRELLETRNRPGVWTLTMREVWEATPTLLKIRRDGQWGPHEIPNVYSVRSSGTYTMRPRALACGREPLEVQRRRHHAKATGLSILHFGWAREEERATRYARYVEHDGGRFHANAHLQSIMWPAARIRTEKFPWPPSLAYEMVMGG